MRANTRAHSLTRSPARPRRKSATANSAGPTASRPVRPSCPLAVGFSAEMGLIYEIPPHTPPTCPPSMAFSILYCSYIIDTIEQGRLALWSALVKSPSTAPAYKDTSWRDYSWYPQWLPFTVTPVTVLLCFALSLR